MYERYISLDEKLEIGRAVYKQELSKNAACNQYEIKLKTVIECVRAYLKANNIDAIPEEYKLPEDDKVDYQEMTKEELIKEIMKKDIEVARVKKGYTVKGGGKTKEFIIINNANSKS